MFLRKLFQGNNKAGWVLIDLLIVIIGVYCAFLIQNYSTNQQNKKEEDRILTALKYELEQFRYTMFQVATGMGNYSRELSKTASENTYSNFSDFRFIEPQYGYQIIEYSLNLQNTDIVDFELYNSIQGLFVEIKKMEHVERLLTETARRYISLPEGLPKSSPEYQVRWAENYDNFNRFTVLIRDRAEIAARVATASADALPIINDRLGPEKTKEIEKEILLSNIDLARNEDEAVQIVKKFFPNFEEEEVRELYRSHQGSGQD